MARTRTRDRKGVGGIYRRYQNFVVTQTIFQDPYILQKDRCIDEVGRSTDHNCDITHWNIDLKPLNGISDSGGGSFREYVNYVPALHASADFGHLPDPSYPSASQLATTLLARTNPGRASVSMPVFIKELKDLPSMVKLAGDTILKRASGAYLSWEFGWKPLISDVRKLLDFQSTTDKRVKELERLYSKGGLKRRMQLAGSGVSNTFNSTIDSSTGRAFGVNNKVFTTRKSWGTVRWLPTELPQSNSPSELRKLARKAVFGLDIQPEDVWNMLPWTWLIDWFSNTGDFLEAHGNRIPCSPSTPCIMTQITTKHDCTRNDSHTTVTGGDSSATVISKIREVTGPGLAADLPFLNGRQLSILGALSIQRLRR